jgi:hypothetical protein
MFLRCIVHDAPKQWRPLLRLAELWYNSCFHTSIGCSPFHALYGHEPDFGASAALDSDSTSPVTGVLTERANQLVLLKKNLELAQQRMKKNADKHQTE